MTSTPSQGNLHLTELCEGLMGNLDVKTVMAKSRSVHKLRPL